MGAMAAAGKVWRRWGRAGNMAAAESVPLKHSDIAGDDDGKVPS
jgi:hypothetical protein